jgi:hypothetical protein
MSSQWEAGCGLWPRRFVKMRRAAVAAIRREFYSPGILSATRRSATAKLGAVQPLRGKEIRARKKRRRIAPAPPLPR